MGTIKRALLMLSSFFQLAYAFCMAFFQPFKGFFSALSTLNNLAYTCIEIVPPWLAGLAVFSLTLGICLLILGRK